MAARARDDALAAEAWPQLIYVVGYLGGRHADALALQLAAEGAVERTGGDTLANARLLGTLGSVLDEQGKYGEAAQHVERALAGLEKALGPKHPEIAATWSRLGTVLLLNNIGAVLEMQQKFAEATPYYERSLAIREKALGPDHASVAASLANLGSALVAQKRYAEGLVRLERAAAIQEKAVGPSSHAVASMLTGIASAYNEKGEPGRARPFAERALAIYAAKSEGVSPIELADTRFHAARALRGSARDRARAMTLATQARDAYAAEEGEYARRALTAVKEWRAEHGGAR